MVAKRTSFLVLGVSLALAVPAWGRPKGGHGRGGPAGGAKAPAAAPSRAPDVAVSMQGGIQHFNFKEGAVVRAQVQKPSVFFVIDHEQLGNYDWESLKQNFLPKILATVQQDPF